MPNEDPDSNKRILDALNNDEFYSTYSVYGDKMLYSILIKARSDGMRLPLYQAM